MGTSSLHPGFSIARVDYRRVTKNFYGNVNNLHLAGSNSHPSRTGWWFQPTPLKNDGVRQLGSWHSQLNGKSWNSCSKLTRSLSSTCLQMIFPLKPPFIMEKNNPFMFQSPPTSKGLIIDQPLGISPRTVRFFGDENGKHDLSSGHLTSLRKNTKNPPVFLCFLQ